MSILGYGSEKEEKLGERDKGNDLECTLLETSNWEELGGVGEFG